jgi:class 3 adenylate cyclase/tRNA A-37 threonylcarbamoyl transferase component Bud32
MTPVFRILVRILRIVAFLFLVSIVALLLPLGLQYLENASSYAWVAKIQEYDARLTGAVRGMVPTKVGNFDLARLVLIGVAYALSRLLEAVANVWSKKIADGDLKKRFDAFKKSSGLSDNSKAVASIKKKMEQLAPDDAKSREDLIRLMVETRKKLDSMSRELAFLSIDVVGSTDMKLGEDKAFVEHDFREYKKLVETAMENQGALKSAWTPDGVMICFGTVDDAIRAAREVLLELARFNREVKSVKTQFRVRCGINAGNVHYEKSQRMEEMSDRVIDVAGHMQKYAAADTIFIAQEVLDRGSESEGFRPTGQKVDGYEVAHWKAPSADATVGVASTPAAERSSPTATRMTPISELSSSRVASTPPQEMTVRAAALANSPITMIGKYELRREVGRGAMGIVFEGWDPAIERRVAVKVIRQDQLDSSEAEEILARFQREAKAAGRVAHPNIVAVYEFGKQNDMYFIAMEYIEGRELKDYFDKNERFTLAEIVRLMGQLLDALDNAGRKGVVHRDIKPANLILLPDGTLKIADFGIARIESSQLTQTGAAIGTPTYMSPEQLLGQPVDGRSDLFSAGVVLYQFLTGEKPFTGERATTVITKILSENPPAPSSQNLTVPTSFDAVMRKALAKKPDERFQNGREFAEALRVALDTGGRTSAEQMPATAGQRADDDGTQLAHS